jgi:hypothetical protein
MSLTDKQLSSSQGATTTHLANEHCSNETLKEKAKLDAALEPLLNLIPDVPYILTFPSYELNIEPWKLHNEQILCRQAYPFRTAELNRQYMSFLWRDSTESCYEIRTELDEERERKAKEQRRPIMSEVAGSSPLPTAGTKKKISFTAYKSKLSGADKSQVASPEPTKADRGEPKIVITNGDKNDTPQNSKPNSETVKDATSKRTETPTRPGKRKSDETTSEPASTPPSKKPRKIGSPERLELPPMLSPLPSDGVELPPMLSPLGLDEFPSFESGHLILPPMLSPTLPAHLEEELERLEKERQRAASNVSTSSDKISTKASSTQSSHKKASALPDPPAKNANHSTTNDKRKEVPIEKTPSLIIKFKFRRMRKDVERILKLPSRRPLKLGAAITFGKSSTTKATKASETNAPLKRKIPDSDNDRLVRKHRKIVNDSPLATSPPSDLATPQASPLVHKTKRPVTPMETSSYMVRSQSNNSRISTPQQQITPLPSSRATDKYRKTSPIPPAKLKQSQELSALSRQFNSLGRTLKHEAQAVQVSSAQSSSSMQLNASEATKTLKFIDCVLAYLLAYAFNDERSRILDRPENYEGSWLTLLPMLDVARSSAKRFEPLVGLVHWLGYVVEKRIVDSIIEELTSATSSSSSDPPLSMDDIGKLHTRLAKAQKKCKDRVREANRKLRMARVQQLFPKTYERATQAEMDDEVVPGDAENLLVTGGVEGHFPLLGVETVTAPQAVRFAISLIKEWVEGQSGLSFELEVCGVGGAA